MKYGLIVLTMHCSGPCMGKQISWEISVNDIKHHGDSKCPASVHGVVYYWLHVQCMYSHHWTSVCLFKNWSTKFLIDDIKTLLLINHKRVHTRTHTRTWTMKIRNKVVNIVHFQEVIGRVRKKVGYTAITKQMTHKISTS